jgi:hypothetical protein
MRQLKATIAAVFGEVQARAIQRRAANAHHVQVREGGSACSPTIETHLSAGPEPLWPQVRSSVTSYDATCKIVPRPRSSMADGMSLCLSPTRTATGNQIAVTTQAGRAPTDACDGIRGPQRHGGRQLGNGQPRRQTRCTGLRDG